MKFKAFLEGSRIEPKITKTKDIPNYHNKGNVFVVIKNEYDLKLF